MNIKRAVGAAVLALATVGMTGCSTSLTSLVPSIEMPNKPADASTPTARPHRTTGVAVDRGHAARSEPRRTAPTATIPPSPFQTGTLTRKVGLGGGAKAVFTYWTKQNPSTWRHDTPVVVQSAVHLEGITSQSKVNVDGYQVSLVCKSGARQLVNQPGGATITAPYSYPSAFTVQCPSGHTASVIVKIDLRAETYAGSGTYYLMTGVDQFNLTFPGDSQ